MCWSTIWRNLESRHNPLDLGTSNCPREKMEMVYRFLFLGPSWALNKKWLDSDHTVFCAENYTREFGSNFHAEFVWHDDVKMWYTVNNQVGYTAPRIKTQDSIDEIIGWLLVGRAE